VGNAPGVALACPYLTGFIEWLQAHRAVYDEGNLKLLIEQHRDKLKPEVI